jgi:arylsulfatase
MTTQPNIVLIMADDMGYSDLGCYGGEIETPTLDRLAGEGLRYRSFYNTARCCPARGSLLTGLYPHQVGLGWMTAADLGTDGYTGDLSANCATIAEALRPAGYRTYLSGKWHVTRDAFTGADGPRHSWPCQRGFDRYIGSMTGGGSYWRPPRFTIGNERVEPPSDTYYTDVISDNACTFIDDHTRHDGEAPFFLYVAYTAPHWPLHASKDAIAKYRGRFRQGWDVLRHERHERMTAMGLLDPRWALSPRGEGIPPWDELARSQQDEYDVRMAIYAAQVEAMDQGIGRVVATLEQHGQLANTLLVFLSDNGGCAEEIHRKSQELAHMGTDRSFESYGLPWANHSNTPFREYKHWVHEGGISTPLIVHWPSMIAAEGVLRDQPGHIIDLMPTCLEAAGAAHPSDSDDSIPPVEGVSLVPSFSGADLGREAIFWEHEGNRAVRLGDWKLVAKGVDGPWELYDMGVDRTELNDLAGKMPRRVKEMGDMWQEYAERTNVFPLDGRDWFERIEDPIASDPVRA